MSKNQSLENPATAKKPDTFIPLTCDGDGWLSESDKENLVDSDDASERSSITDASSSFQAPDFLIHPEANRVRDYENISFAPDIKEDEPVIGAPTETVKALGINVKNLALLPGTGLDTRTCRRS
nr:unnamed protein product [Callosobruchus analis]